MIHLPELTRILPRQIARFFRRIVARQAPHHWGYSRLGLVMAAAFTAGCTEASSPGADDRAVVDVVWEGGRKTRMELPSPEPPAEQQGGPVAFLLVEDGEIVQEFVEARFARRRPAGQASLQDVEDVADRPCRPDELPVLQLINHLKSAIPSSSDLDRLSPEGVDRVSAALEQLSEETLVCIEGLAELADSLTAATSSGSQ